ncbi:MAG: CsgG/HfaB family protein [Kiritimatiellia bacterium]|jgi:curli biogenesis system outer membrane secretion channel CsgG|nr:CsgG/HfaB family protein [Kiritimatiellia bacterium]
MRRQIRTLGWTILAIATLAVAVAQAKDSGGNLRYSITVSKFKNEASWHGRWNVGDGFATMLTDALQQSGKFIVLGDTEMRGEALREQDLAATGRMAGGKKAPKIGRMTPAQLLVRGSITHVESATAGGGGGLSFKGIRIGGKGGKGEVNITMYLVDSETGQVTASTKVVGKSGKRGLSLGYHGSKLGGLRGDLAGFTKDNVGKACQDAVGQGVEFLAKQLDSIPWEGSIVFAKPDKIIINRGSREGVSEGMVFKVGSVEEIVDPDTGEVLDTEMTKAGKIEVTQVKEKLSYCKPLDGAAKIEKGMTINP